MQNYIKKLISERESKMYGYYKSVFEEGFDGGYPVEYDEDLLKVEQVIMKKIEEWKPIQWDEQSLAEMKQDLKELLLNN